MKVWLCILALLALSLGSLGAVPAGAQVIWNVPTDPGAATIQEGINSASAGDIVLVACDTYFEFNIQMKSGITLASASADPACVIIDAEGQGPVIVGQSLSNTSSITFITFTGGLNGSGGGMVCKASEGFVTACVFLGNTADSQGGGVFCTEQDKTTFTDCVFENNSAIDGAGLYSDGSAPSFIGCTFRGNVASSAGGGIAMQGSSGLSTPAISSTLFTANSAGTLGGGFYARISLPTIAFNTFHANAAATGGGMAFETTSPVILNTIVSSSTQGQAIYADEFSDLSFNSCDLYGNAGGDWVGAFSDQVGTNANFSGEPGYCDAENGDFQLCDDSWCLAGTLFNGQFHPLDIGAFGEGCGPCGPFVKSESKSWGGVKSLYR